MPTSSFSIKPVLVLIIGLLLSILSHWNIWGSDIIGIHAWRQTQTMTVVENFSEESMNILNPRINSRGDGDGIFRMEFPLMQWGFAWFYRWFGNEMIVFRVLSFLIFFFGAIGFYRLLRSYRQSRTISISGAWCYAWSPVLFYYSVNPLPDNLALCFTIWSLVFLKTYDFDKSIYSLIYFSIFLSLATAVKLPFILFGAGIIPLFISGFASTKPSTNLLHTTVVAIIMLPALVWYSWVIPQWTNAGIIGGISAEANFDYQSALNTIWGTFHSLLPELLINYGSLLFFIAGIVFFVSDRSRWSRYKSELSILGFVALYYLYEINMIGLVHDYYLFPFLPLIFLVVAAGAKYFLSHGNTIIRSIGILAILILPLTAYLRTVDRWNDNSYQHVLIEHKEQLREIVPDSALVVAGNDESTHIFLYHIHKKGWTFEQNWLNSAELDDHFKKGARFLYVNSDLLEKRPSIHQQLDGPILTINEISVYRIKALPVLNEFH